MILLDGHSLTAARKVPAEALSLTLNERESSASFTPTDMTGISVGSWLQDDTAPGEGIVWVVRTIRQTYLDNTPVITLDHAVNTLRDRILFGEITPATITGATGATTCTARQAINYILNQQSDWTLGTFDYDNVSNPYKFDGDTLYDALENVSDSLDGAWWSYDFSTYPFRINITEKSETVGTVLRAGRNLSAVTQTIDRTGMYTRFYPIGKDDLHISGNYVSKNESTYGVIAKVEVDTSLTTTTELTAWANERLDKHAEPKVTVEVDGFELADATGESLDALELGKKCRIPLPEYVTMITETITVLNYPDKIHQPDVVRITLANTKTDVTRIIADAIKQAGSGGRGSARQDKEDHAWFEDTDEYVAMVAEKTGIDGLGPDETLYSRLQVEAGKITALTEKTGVNSLGQDETIYGLLEVEAGKVAMVVGTSSGQNYIKAAEISASINNAGQGVALINADHVNISATNTAHVLAGSITYDEYGNLVLKESSGGGIVIERESGGTTAQFGVYDEGTLTAGVIATTVNGTPSVYITADNIKMSSASDARSVQVEVNGKLTAYDITASFINSLYSGTSALHANLGTVSFLTSTFCSADSISLDGSSPFSDCIISATVNTSSNVLTLTTASGNTVTFSKATPVTTVSAVWSGATYTIAADAGGQALPIDMTVYINATTRSGQYSDEFMVYPATPNGSSWDNHGSGKVGQLVLSGSGSSAKIDAEIGGVKVAEYSVGTIYTEAYNEGESAGYTSGYTAGNTAGVNSVTVYSVGQNGSVTYNSSTKVYSIPIIGTASNSETKTGTISLTATDAYNSGWSGCYNTVGLNTTTQQDLGYSGSVTIYAQAKSSSGASSKTNVASVKITAPADRYQTGYNAGVAAVTVSSVGQNGSVTYNSTNNTYSIPIIGTASNSKNKTGTISLTATAAYNAGWNACRAAATKRANAIYGYTANNTNSALFYGTEGRVQITGVTGLTWVLSPYTKWCEKNDGFKGGTKKDLYELPAAK